MDSPSPAPARRLAGPHHARRQHLVPARVAPAGRLGDGAGQLGRQPLAVVGDPDGDVVVAGRLGGDDHPGLRRVVGEGVADQVHEDLLEPVVVGPDRGQAGRRLDLDQRRGLGRQHRDGGVEHQRDVAPVALQPEHARLDRGEVEQVVDEAAEPGRLGRDAGQEPLLGGGVPGHVLLQQGGRVAGDRGQRGPQLVAEPAQERLLQLARVPQRHRLLVRDQRPLPLERHPQRVGRVLEQVGRLVLALAVRPRRQQHGPPGRGGERHPLVPAGPGDAGGDAVRPAAVERALAAAIVAPERRRRRRPASCARPGVGAHRHRAVGGRGRQRRLVGPEAAPQRLQRDRQAGRDRHRARQRLQDLPDRLEQPVARRHLVEQPVALDRAGGVAGVERGQVEVVAAGLARHRPEHGDDAEQPARAEHRHRPGAGDLGRPGQVAEVLPRARDGPDVVLDDRRLPLGRQPDRPARRAERQPRPRVEQPLGHPEGRGPGQLAVVDQVDAEPLAAERGAERGQDQRQARGRVGGDQPPGQPVQPGELAPGRGVDRLARDQRHHVVRAHLVGADLGDHPAVPQHHDPVRQPEHQPGVVAGQQDRGALLAQPGDEPLDQRRLLHPERGGRLVEQQQPGVVGHRPGDRHHLPLAARQRPDRQRGVPHRDAELREQPGRLLVQCDVGEHVPASLVAEHHVRRHVEVLGQARDPARRS